MGKVAESYVVRESGMVMVPVYMSEKSRQNQETSLQESDQLHCFAEDSWYRGKMLVRCSKSYRLHKSLKCAVSVVLWSPDRLCIVGRLRQIVVGKDL